MNAKDKAAYARAGKSIGNSQREWLSRKAGIQKHDRKPGSMPQITNATYSTHPADLQKHLGQQPPDGLMGALNAS